MSGAYHHSRRNSVCVYCHTRIRIVVGGWVHSLTGLTVCGAGNLRAAPMVSEPIQANITPERLGIAGDEDE